MATRRVLRCLTVCWVLGMVWLPLPGSALDAAGSWEAEFEAVSVGTGQALALPRQELLGLVERCDRLRPALESLEETPRKVYLKRLEKARSLFLYVLESRDADQNKAGDEGEER